MEPRDLFDVLLVVLVGLALYLQFYGLTLSTDLVWAIVEALQNVDLVYYLIVAGVLGIFFIIYMTIYAPRKYGKGQSG